LGDELSFIWPVSIFVAVLVIQYARRWTGLAWTLIAVVAMTISIAELFGPENFAMSINYPVRTDATQPHIEFRQVPAVASATTFNSVDEREFTMAFPVAVSGIAHNMAVKVENARVALTTANGVRWSSHWQNVNLTWLPGETDGIVSLKINRAFYDRVKDKPLTVELSVALAMLKSGNVTHLMLPEKTLEIPGGSICRNSGVGVNDLSCLSPMRQPRLMLVTTRFSAEGCSNAPPSNDGDLGLGWMGTLDTQPADFGITSVWESSVYLERYSSAQSSQRQYLCPGSPIFFTPYTVVSRGQQNILSQPLNLKSLIPSRF